jgi:hypothetical protein
MRLALTEEFIPSPFDAVLVILDDLQQFPKRSSVVTIIVCHTHFRFQPEFCFNIVFFNVNVNRLAWRSFIGIEEKPETPMVENDWHCFHFINIRSSLLYVATGIVMGALAKLPKAER